jgi:hypothetical protein
MYTFCPSLVWDRFRGCHAGASLGPGVGASGVSVVRLGVCFWGGRPAVHAGGWEAVSSASGSLFGVGVSVRWAFWVSLGWVTLAGAVRAWFPCGSVQVPSGPLPLTLYPLPYTL